MDLLRLQPSESAVYRALLRRPGADVDALVGLVRLDPAVVQQAVDALTARGLLQDLVPRRPDAVLEPLLVEVEQEIASTRSAVLAARRELGELVELYAGGRARSDRTVEVERIDGGREAVQRRIDELLESLSYELLALNPRLTQPAQLAVEKTQTAEMLARGLTLRSILGPAVLDAPQWLQHAREMDALGDRMRVHPDPPLQMLLLDRRVAVVPIDPDASSDGALFVWSTTLVRSFLLLYEALWEQARPIVRAEDVEGLGEREARLLELLADGMKDETVARHLGVSLRTVRREAAVLLDRLGAQTRFQAGVEAARRGWL